MVNFRDRIRTGFAAHELADAAQQEIKSVISAVNDAIKAETNGRVGFEVFEHRPTKPIPSLVAQIAAGIQPLRETAEPESWLAVVRSDEKKSVRRKLARWDMSVEGYPCVVKILHDRTTAYDKTSLEEILGQLLEHPETGKAIHELMQD